MELVGGLLLDGLRGVWVVSTLACPAILATAAKLSQ